MYLTLQLNDAMPLGQDADRLAYGRQIIRAEAAALEQVAQRLDQAFLQAVDLFYHCAGRVGITGTGKSADVGHKIAGTLNSTGTRAYNLDATRAVHGDLGMVHPNDVVLVLSHSGESEEILRLLGPLRQLAAGLVALTGNRQSTLARHADVALVLGPIEEACPLGLAPSTSTTAMIAVGDALAFVLSRMRQFSHEDFARFHPAGNLGRKLVKVDAVMRRDHDLRLASCQDTVREVFARVRLRGRRTGAVMLTDGNGRLCGLFTDSDLARLFEQRRDAALDKPIREVMTPDPITVPAGARVAAAVEVLRQRKISELPVIDADGRPVGLIDITDLIGLLPAEETNPVALVA
ncbi:MAG TPA: KpsF/GutQ family sugar-phosphate isomerase [Gemmataceae bacterium]|jgi:arabinose-5-phosphate isomerase|nr:KpsF/GutQ family sugar-phosphate isomerase [Gemmataceae bacterium]